MMATDVLKQQHREVEELFRQLETAEDHEERTSLRAELADMLAAHTAIEEELFYPAALDLLGPGARVRESLEEHAVADFALYRFVSVSVADETFLAKLATLKDVVMNHVEAEESEMLPQVEGEMDRQVLDQLGERLTARFEERLREGHRPILERSLGIAARQVAQSAPGAKKAAAPSRRATAKRGTAQKRPAAAATKRIPAQKRPATTAKRGATSKGAPAAKKTAGRAQGGARSQQPPQGQTGARGQTSRGSQKSASRSTSSRTQAPAKKQRAAR